MKKGIILLIVFMTLSTANAQLVYEPLHSDVYSFLSRLSQKNIIELSDLIKPLSRKYILERLLEAENKIEMLTALERQELDFFLKDYFLEKQLLEGKDEKSQSAVIFGKDKAERYRLFSYNGEFLKANVSPVLGIEASYPNNKRNIHTWNGLSAFGYLSDNFGFSLDFKISSETGTYIDTFKHFSPVTGVIPIHNGEFIDYSQVKSMISADWDWGNIVAAKDFIKYGHAKNINLVLSEKAPPFFYIRLQIKPVDWLKFYYFHAWLSSNVIDSLNLLNYDRDIYESKYLAWHALVVTPINGLDISIGESIVYANKIEPVYLIPFTIFYLMDDYISRRRDKPGDANSQIFLSVSSRGHLKNTHIYGTLFIDELTLAGLTGTVFSTNKTSGSLFDSPRNRTQVAFMLGLSAADLPFNNLTFTTEYTRINPFVYQHHDPAQTYTNSSYLMGSWTGPNSDLFYLELNYRIIRGLQLNLWGEYIRKGRDSNNLQYENKYQPPFLYGEKKYYKYLGLKIKYELIHELNFELSFRKNLTSFEQDDGAFLDNRINQIGFSVYYGVK